jgi:molecular chaperone DnaK
MAGIVGIDLGTTKCAVAVWQNGEPRIIPDASGENIIPSVVAFDSAKGKWVVGHAAKQLAVTDPQAAIYSAKRLMGRRFSDDAVRNALADMHILYALEKSKVRRDGIDVVVGDKHLTPQEVSAKLLAHLKATAEAELGQEVTEAVITVPAYFHDSQRQATRDAGRLAGLEVKRVLNEPTAACLAFGFQRLADERKKVAVYDLGGGTFDISILEIGRGPFRVLATHGDDYLGGDDLDWLIVDWAIDQLGGNEQTQIKEDVHALARLRAAAEAAKKDLSSQEKTVIKISGALSADIKITDLSLELTREKLEELTEPLIKRTLKPCEQALHDARVNTSDIKEVLLVGGQTRMPAIRRAVRDFFGIEPNTSVKPEEVVALGAAVQSAIMAGVATNLKLADVVPLSLGVNSKGMMDTIIARNTPIPVHKTKNYSTDLDNQDTVEISIYQGEGIAVAENNKLGGFLLKGILPAPAGEPDIEVTFHVDQDGILHVTGKDLKTGNSHETTITDSMRLSDAEIEAMIQAGSAASEIN